MTELIEFTKGQRSALHTVMLDSLGVTHGPPETATEAQLQAFCETVCHVEHIGEVFELSRALDAFVVDAIFGTEFQFVEVDADALRSEIGTETVNLALRMIGIRPRPAGHSRTIWTDSPDHHQHHRLSVTIPADLLEKWNR